ncbi:hypothetical protein NQ314_007376 [Rhamnusium bicolor]|uniref:Retrotransposon gag domain-containing protein n=1 Tax=Rhamnusium bicolor TaxID=1586634 RepID=A0AAV8YQT8_9CUCU|nr:hypothetical protein NQ314_007376 [Rhamnusium bicolor]
MPMRRTARKMRRTAPKTSRTAPQMRRTAPPLRRKGARLRRTAPKLRRTDQRRVCYPLTLNLYLERRSKRNSRKKRTPRSENNIVQTVPNIDGSSTSRQCHTPPLPESLDRVTRLERLVEKLVGKQVETISRPHKVFIKPECIPEFCPGNPNLSSSKWIEKIEQLASVNHWDEPTMIFHMQSRLTGLARKWYDNLQTYQLSWDEWKELLLETFPEHQDFAVSLRKLMNRHKQETESWEQYYFDKMELIGACEIDGKKAVSCLIDGIRDTSIQAGARAGRYVTPGSLYAEYLSTLGSECTRRNGYTDQVKALIVPSHAQDVPVMVGQTFLNRPEILMVVSAEKVRLLPSDIDLRKIDDVAPKKIPLWAKVNTVIPPRAVMLVEVTSRGCFLGGVYVQGGPRAIPVKEHFVDECITKGQDGFVSIANLSWREIESPYELLFGYTPRGIANAVLDNEISVEPSRDQNILETRKTIQEQIEKKQAKRKAKYDAHRYVGPTYKVGEQVLVRTSATSNQGQSRKLLPKYTGPYVIIKVLDHNRYVIHDIKGSSRSQRQYKGIVSLDKLKAFNIEVSLDSNEESEETEMRKSS